MLLLFCCFFSSRRRHTRLQGDWSSDVCSSDLHRSQGRGPVGTPARLRPSDRLVPDQPGHVLRGARSPGGGAPGLPELVHLVREIGRASCRDSEKNTGGAVTRREKEQERTKRRG